MFNSKTLFILGAGSSAEVGLPLGSELKERISQKIDINFKYGHSQISGDSSVMKAIYESVGFYAKIENGMSREDANSYLRKAKELCNALPQALSIDNLLDAHRSDLIAERCGKFGIVKSILESEKSSSIFKSRMNSSIDFGELSETWFAAFIQMLTEGVPKGGIDKIFSNVSFINFNYDRCIEHYVFEALQAYYGLDPVLVSKVMGGLQILRPYGSVGELPWQQTAASVNVVPFGHERVNVFQIAKGIQTFNEQIQSKDELEKIRKTVGEAEVIVFLGFAYHKQNMELLQPVDVNNVKRVYGTCFGVSQSNTKIIKQEMYQFFGKKSPDISVVLNAQKKCGQFFREYWRGINS